MGQDAKESEEKRENRNMKTIIILFLTEEKTQLLLVPTKLNVNQASPR